MNFSSRYMIELKWKRILDKQDEVHSKSVIDTNNHLLVFPTIESPRGMYYINTYPVHWYCTYIKFMLHRIQWKAYKVGLASRTTVEMRNTTAYIGRLATIHRIRNRVVNNGRS